MDRIIETDGGFDIICDGKQHGTWRSRAEAKGGLQVEQRREAVKKVKQMALENDA